MRRQPLTPRPDWQSKVEALGLTFHTIEGKPYWNESACYVFDPDEIATLEAATNELHERCLDAVEHVISRGELHRLCIPEEAHGVIAAAWEADPPAIYGRFDLAYDGTGPPKLLEYNADTPTSLLEAAVIQWHWLQELYPEADQFNSIWEGLVEKWRALDEEGFFARKLVHFGCMDEMEDLMTVAVLMDTAREVGLQACPLHMSEIGWDGLNKEFVDPESRRIETLFKLYPWEWMLRDKFGALTLRHYADVSYIEPIWKMVLSNKGILAILWELFPGHPNLLASYFDGPRGMTDYVCKPMLGREGANVSVFVGGGVVSTEGPYGGEGVVYQEYVELGCFGSLTSTPQPPPPPSRTIIDLQGKGESRTSASESLPGGEGGSALNYAVIGSWVIDGVARGIGIRESDTPITDDLARFVPHYFVPGMNNLEEKA